MKLIGLIMIAGLVPLYFMNAAFRIEMLHWEMLIHSGIRFFIGFILLGTSVFYAHALKFKSAAILVLALVLGDDVMDYFRNVGDFRFESMFHDIYMLLWGSLVGYLFMKNWRKTEDRL